MRKNIFRGILVLFLLGSALQTVRILGAVMDKRQLDYGEGIILWQALQVFHLKSAFHPLQQYPYIVFHYTPLYHIAVRSVMTFVGDPLLSGRLVSMMAAFWLIGLFVWVVLKATRGYADTGARWFGALFAGAWVLLVPAMQWAPLARVDMLGLALQFTALSIVCARPMRLRSQIVAFCLLLLGLYTKQSLFAIPIASILLIGLMRRARAFWLASGLAAAGLGVLCVLARATDGGVIRHWILYNINPFHFRDALRFESDFARSLLALIATGLTAFALTLPHCFGWPNCRRALSARLAGSRLRRTGVGFGLAATFGFIVSWGIGKEGANVNYGLDWQLALCPLTGTFMVLFLRSWRDKDRGMVFLRPLVAVLLSTAGILLGIQAFDDCNRGVGLTRDAHEKILAYRREDVKLVQLISTFPGPVVSENMTALLQAGKSIPFEPAIVKQTTDTRVFDEEALLTKTSDRFFDAFILTNNAELHFTPQMLRTIRQNYEIYPFGGSLYTVYVRRQP